MERTYYIIRLLNKLKIIAQEETAFVEIGAKKDKLNIGLDLDGTLTTMDSIIDVFNRETGKKLTADDYRVYHLGEVYGMTNDELRTVWGQYEYEIYDRALPIWNLHAFMDKWRKYQTKDKKGNKIYIVTSRPEKQRGVTEQWLKRNHIKYDGLFMGYHTKLTAVVEHGLDVVVDDKAEHIQLIDKEPMVDCEAFLVDRPYNRWYQTEKRVYVQDIPFVTI